MRGLSTVAAFVFFIVIFAIFVATAIYYYQLLRQTAVQGEQQVRSAALPPDQPASLAYNGTCIFSAAGPGSPFAYYLEVGSSSALVLSSPVSPQLAGAFSVRCPPGPGLYKYIGVRQNGQLAYMYVYVGPSAAWVAANGTVAAVRRVGDSAAAMLYLNVYDNSTGYLPASFSVSLIYNTTLLSCTPSTFSAGPTAFGPGEQVPIYLGTATCRALAPFTSTVVKAVVTQSYGAYSWSWTVPFVLEIVNASSTAPTGPPPASGVCSFAPLNGSKLSGFNQMNGWIGAWGGSSSGYAVAVRPGLLVPAYATGGSGWYYVQLQGVQIGTLAVSSAPATVQVGGAMPSFLASLRIYITSSSSSAVLYLNGTSAAVPLQPGTYSVYVDVRAKGNAPPGASATLYLSCGSLSYPINFEIPQWSDWGIPVNVYWGTKFNTYVGTWSVGGVYFWLTSRSPPLSSQGPYFTIYDKTDTAPQWAAAWLNPTATAWDNWSLNYTGTLYIPWNEFNVGVWHADGAAVSVCGRQVISALYFTSPRFDSVKARCAAGPNQVVVEYFEGSGGAVLMFVVGPPKGQSAYVPTIDGAWYCRNFNWGSGSYGSGAGTCNSGWTFLPASSGNVPYWIVGKYAPGSSDGGGSPSP